MNLGALVHLLPLVVALALPATASAASSFRVVDGDTVDLDGVRFRLHGIDAPESGQACASARGRWPCGQAATDAMEKMTSGKTVKCESRGSDGYGRMIGICSVDGVDLNALMVRAGMAWAYRKYSMDYVAQEDEARAAGLGVWQAETETAWDFRAHRWEASLQQAPDSKCPIKGNINRKHESIYHVPWSKDYSRTKVNTARGERWFCSEDEALKAGWRAPLWGSQ